MEHKGDCTESYISKAKSIIDDRDDSLRTYRKQKQDLKSTTNKAKKKELRKDLRVTKKKLRSQSKEFSNTLSKAKRRHKIDSLDINSLSKKRKLLK